MSKSAKDPCTTDGYVVQGSFKVGEALELYLTHFVMGRDVQRSEYSCSAGLWKDRAGLMGGISSCLMDDAVFTFKGVCWLLG